MKNFLRRNFKLLVNFAFLALIIFFASSCSILYPYVGIWENSGTSLGNNYRIVADFSITNFTISVYKNGALNSGGKGKHELERNGNIFEGSQYQEQAYENGQWITKYEVSEVRYEIVDGNKLYIYYKTNNQWYNWLPLFGFEYLIKK